MSKYIFKKFIFIIISLVLLCIAVWYVGINNLSDTFKLFPFKTIYYILFFLAVNFILVSFRLSRLICYFYVKIPFLTVVKANIQGNFASLFVISLFGHVVGRQQVMKSYGISPVLVAMLTGIERAGIAIVSGGAGFLGASWLLDSSDISEFLGATTIPQLIIAVISAFIVSFWIGRSVYESKLVLQLFSKQSTGRVIETLMITLCAQFCILLSFAIAAKSLSPEISWIGILSAAAVTSFAASLPISVNGWGIRELTAVFAFSYIGIPEHYALSISILVGVCSTIIIVCSFPISIAIKNKKVNKVTNRDIINNSYSNQLSGAKISSWLLSYSVSILIFFQVYIPVFGSVINVNLADAFALLSLASLFSLFWFNRLAPNWKIRNINIFILIFTLMIFLSLINGSLSIGITQWAFIGRFLGWFVLLGYLGLSALIVSYLGKRGIRRTIETLVITACVIIFIQLTLRYLANFGYIDDNILQMNFEGYAGNRNAFVFQLITCSIFMLTQSWLFFREKNLLKFNGFFNRYNFFIFIHGVILFGVILTGSKAGVITEIVLLVISYKFKLSQRKFLISSILMGGGIWAIFVLIIPSSLEFIFSSISYKIELGIHSSNANSALERWQTIVRGIELWMKYPVFGSGLGVFIEESTLWFDRNIVIHCTQLWILAEFGLVGAAILIFIFYSIYHQSIQNIRQIDSKTIVLLLTAFFIFGLFHDIFYQRIFWFGLGLCCTYGVKRIVFSHRLDLKN